MSIVLYRGIHPNLCVHFQKLFQNNRIKLLNTCDGPLHIGAVVTVIVQLPMQSVPITTDQLRRRCTTLCDKVFLVTCDRSGVFSGYSGLLH